MQQRLRTLLFFILLLPFSVLATQFSNAQQTDFGNQSTDFLDPKVAFTYELEQDDSGNTLIHWQVEPGYYLYRERLSASDHPLELPAGNIIEDEFFGRSEVYNDDFTMRIQNQGTAFTLVWQGCAEAGLCYPPMHDDIPGESITDTNDSVLAADQSITERLSSQSVVWVVLGFFVMGLLLTFTPCVLPMIPIISSIVVGSQLKGREAFYLSLAYVLPMALTYAFLGVIAALAGAGFQATLQSPVTLSLFAGVFIIFALAMFGVFELQLPAPLRDHLTRLSSQQRGGHFKGAIALGVLSAILVGPCMTAPLAGALLYISQSGDITTGFSALFALGMGMGVPLLIVGTLGGQFLPKPGSWMNRIKAVFGFILLGTAVWFIERIVPGHIALTLWAGLILGLGTTLALYNQAAWMRIPGVVLAVWATLIMFNAIQGAQHFTEVLSRGSSEQHESKQSYQSVESLEQFNSYIEQANTAGQYVFVDFYADWCVSCKVIERNILSRDDVQQQLSGMLRLRPDVTKNNNEQQELMRELNVLGPPTMLFIDPNGQEIRAERIVGEINAKQFLQHLSRVQLNH
ncbi:thiol:disulfide interchange protein [Aliidiomarina minuta]|uniref:Thiol:disulfide interchange protein DsbD n=1 Tax=Aliidiomarina minuta TaxID=880057 RepID=A0A432W645_9GAMM|nr:protein-disulfide reductase DsbD [Aliidiomarina minuta]RUO25545.1 thiol:disulfide interchange protein [Aliidiomarina minuta]